jgi:hypothetical protein
LRKAARVLVISDLHCGHIVGLTHPDFNPRYEGAGKDLLGKHRLALWRWYERQVDALKPVDALIVNGDAIDGKGDKSGATELITTDRNEQCSMAIAAIETIGAKEIYMSYGTPYHTGRYEDWERQIADHVGARIDSHGYLDIRGLVFDYRHFVGASSVPHGRHKAIAKEHLWNVLWAEHGEYPKADVLIRSHVHYFVGAFGPNWLAMITPALQHYGSKYGARKCSGKVDFGFVFFDIVSKDDWTWQKRILTMPSARRQLVKANC